MRTPPARRVALSACCAVLLVGITGPVAAAAAAPARERTPATSSDTLLVQVRSPDAQEGALIPVVGLSKTLTATEPATTATPTASNPATTATTPKATSETPATANTLLTDEADLTSDVLDVVREDVDSLLDLPLFDGEEDTAQAPRPVGGLLTEAVDFLTALLGTFLQLQALPAPAGATPAP